MNNFFNRNTTAKIISVFFALIMWTYVMGEINPKMTREFTNVSVQLLNVEELRQQGLVIVGEVSDNIRVTIRGRRDEIFKINKNDIRATADLRGYKVGDNNIPVEVASLGNIEVDYFPKFIKVELEEVIRRQKEVDLLLSGKPRGGYILSQSQYRPTVVWIEGPASVVNAVDRVIANLEINDEAEDIVASLPLKAVDSRGAEVLNVDIKPPYIDVYLPVERMKTVKIQPQVEATAAEGYRITNITVLPEQVTLRGQRELIENITSIETEELLFENLTQTEERTVELNLPEGITIFNEDSIKIRVEVEGIEEKTLAFPKDRISIIGVPEGFQVDLSQNNQPETFEIKVVAVSSVINRIEINDIQVIADLSNVTSGGSRDIELMVMIPRTPAGDILDATVVPRVLNVRLIESSQ